MCNFYKNINKKISNFGEFLMIVSTFVLVASFIFSIFYAIFFNNEDKYIDVNNVSAYIAVWAVLLAVGVKIVDRSPNSFLKSNIDDISKKEE
ncbi:hypothetical protein [Arcobacter porcinus]|uniref:Putative membrane protein n=1 Tax=Arcobacter porcinus TaxID=1935204 RepID=A0A5C2HC26_9BACT|nr:hypothetical protein [Arcobacter porcinus]OCL89424.1 hypothetical protein AAX27_01955 [Aliarcobacter thereius]QEP40437.1 putative membrane protein [Arcobacter porcinus]